MSIEDSPTVEHRRYQTGADVDGSPTVEQRRPADDSPTVEIDPATVTGSAPQGGGLSSGMRWSGISMAGRQVFTVLFTIVLARIVGPDSFGIVAQATVYIGVVGLLLDQGFSSALIQRPIVEKDMPGAVVTVNLGIGALLAVITVAIAPAWALFMETPALTGVLMALAPTLFIRSLAITPRAMLLRGMEFRKIGIADITSAALGGAVGVTYAALGGGYWALVAQILSTDIVLAVVMLLAGAGRWPNLRMHRLKEIAGFSWRAFAAGLLINSVSRNIDNVLVGRFQGPEQLAFYGLAYRLLLLPVQLASTMIGTVLFPAFSRLAGNLTALASETAKATRALAALVLPAMALVAAAAPQIVLLLFGHDWLPAVPIVQVLATAGAFQAIYTPSHAPLVLGLGEAGLNLKLAWLTTIVSTVGIVAGLPFGAIGVAIGYTIATVALVPVEWVVRRRLVGMTLRSQIATLGPGLHVGFWMAVVYLAIAVAIDGHDLIVLIAGLAAAVAAALAVLRLAHRTQLRELLSMGNSLAGRFGRS
ncbi:lipopolysaccharide biosynthesis protein [Dactylosporangium matsuzakiense]|uniref:PST family polysaccharide transporter n=1 Tax=Dactylosporangium matsuzakiense TaxID=53360 RepID=A0A9W6KU02_9ACTN|nr:lipopolysaccharide biosynthesis protein [Dactylosporangium matsuzakiense]UWZ46195.1 lipopolysaccharide biosynthesis protein [Dactylosporangium matsuzakiense]GLL07192.1 hypothetical protein GCM10017581_089440 [Dactylosporangium matsuzakiense]